jgi:hypothetical protein
MMQRGVDDHKNHHECSDDEEVRKVNWQTCMECTCQEIYGNDIEAELMVEHEAWEYLYEGDRTGWTDEDIEAIADLAWGYLWWVPVEDKDQWAETLMRAIDEYYDEHPEVLARVLGGASA